MLFARKALGVAAGSAGTTHGSHPLQALHCKHCTFSAGLGLSENVPQSPLVWSIVLHIMPIPSVVIVYIAMENHHVDSYVRLPEGN